MANNPWWRVHELKLALGVVERYLKSGVFEGPGRASHECEAFFTHAMICLCDVVKFLSANNDRITINNDVVDVAGKPQDVTDLIHRFRNVVCHLPSEERSLGEIGRLSFCVLRGISCIVIDDVKYASEYGDDIAFFYGSHRIYLNRHIRAAWSEANERIRKYR